jgi:glycine cleavage system aminomethyltransferase T
MREPGGPRRSLGAWQARPRGVTRDAAPGGLRSHRDGARPRRGLAPGGALCTGTVCWCAPTPERVLVLPEPSDGDRLLSRIRRLGARHPDLRIRDLSHAWSAIAIVGRQAGDVLARLGAYGATGDPRSVAPASSLRVAGSEVTWLLQSDHRALALMGHSDAPAVWHALHAAGQPFGICAVGQQAIARYTLLARPHTAF